MKMNLSERQEDRGPAEQTRIAYRHASTKNLRPGKAAAPNHSGTAPDSVSAIESFASSSFTLKSSSFETFLSVSLTLEMT